MTLGDLLDEIRSRYLAQFRASIAKITSAGRRAIVEAAFRDEHGARVAEGIDLPAPTPPDMRGRVRGAWWLARCAAE